MGFNLVYPFITFEVNNIEKRALTAHITYGGLSYIQKMIFGWRLS